jgi:2-methylcitrate dehydratase PrpD
MTITTQGVFPATLLVNSETPAWLERWSSFAANVRFGDLPDVVVDRARLVWLDCLGAIVAGAAEPEMRAAAGRLADSFGSARSPMLTAFAGGTAGTMLEIDEGNQYARGHPAIHVAPAIMAVARRQPVSGREALLALVLGYEIGARIGIASKLRVTMHPHGTWGVVGAAVAVANLDGACAHEIAAVVNVASSLGLATSRRTMLEGATVRNSYAGVANMMGLLAWDLAKSGFTGERDGVASVFGGITADDFRTEEMVQDLGSRWEIARNYFKRHAACRYTHAALDALERIVEKAGGPIRPGDVESLSVETYVWAAQLDHPKPESMLAAKFSLPFSLATALAHGGATLDAFRDEARADPGIVELAAKIRIDEDPALTAMMPGLRPARVRLTLKDGRTFEAMATTNKGDTEDPYGADDIIAKFHEVVTPVLGREKAVRIAAACLDLEREASFGKIAALCEAS